MIVHATHSPFGKLILDVHKPAARRKLWERPLDGLDLRRHVDCAFVVGCGVDDGISATGHWKLQLVDALGLGAAAFFFLVFFP